MDTRLKIALLLAACAMAAASLFIPWQARQSRGLVQLISQLDGQWVGREAPSFELTDLEGRPHRLSDYRGQVIFLNVWASFCAPCREEMPSMERLVRTYEERGMVMLAVTVDPQKQDAQAFMQEFLPGQRSAMTVLHDPNSSTAHAYGTELLPETYIIDKQGQIVARFVNAYDWTRPEVRQLIETLLAH